MGSIFNGFWDFVTKLHTHRSSWMNGVLPSAPCFSVWLGAQAGPGT